MPSCFVIMGFGLKTDLATGRVLDLDKSYKNIIKPAVENAGFTCIRADEIQHSGMIDVPMYEMLYSADLVVADLSTANLNAVFEPRCEICAEAARDNHHRGKSIHDPVRREPHRREALSASRAGHRILRGASHAKISHGLSGRALKRRQGRQSRLFSPRRPQKAEP